MVANVYYEAFVDEELPSLEGKCVLITGTTSGTGYWCAMAAIKKGVSILLLLNRASSRASAADAEIVSAAKGTNTSVQSVVCDLMSFASVHKAADEVEKTAKGCGLDVLAANAGIMCMPDDRTEDGYDVQMQVNHLSHFLLTLRLMPVLEKAAANRGEARVVIHSSAARYLTRGKLPFGATMEKCEKGTLGGNGGSMGIMNFVAPQNVRYHHSKAANAVFTQALHEKLVAKGSKVKSLCCEPGLAETSLLANGFQTASDKSMPKSIKSAAMSMFKCSGMMQSGADGAMPLMAACFSSEANSGDMYCPKQMAPLPPPTCMMINNKGLPKRTIIAGKSVKTGDSKEAHSLDAEVQSMLWTKSEAAVGLTF